MKRITVTLITGLLLLAACAAPAVEQVETPAVTAPPPAALALVAPDEESGKLSARPLDAQSLDDLPGRDTVDFGHHYTHALSPDSRTLALIAWPAGSHSQGGALRLVDLSSWEIAETGVTVDGHTGSLAFSPDGRAVYWAKADLRDTAHAVARDYRLYRYDVNDVAEAEDAEAETVAALPASFTPWEMRMLPGGERLAIFGVPVDGNYLAEGPPRVLLVDLSSGELAADVALEGVTAGQFQVEFETEDQSPYRIVRPALAWDLARSLLYVVHGDENMVTVVDLAEGAVRRQVEVRPQASLLERIVGWGASTAAAKLVPSTDKRAALSPDGRRLFVTGLRREMRPDWSGQGWPYDETPLGLQVIDVETLTEVARVDLPVTDLALAPDGRRLLAAGAYNVPNADGGSERVAHGVYLLDGASLDVVAHVLPEEDVTLRAFSPDGGRAYVSTATSEWLDGHGHRNWRTALHLLDLETGLLTAEKEFPGSFLDVVANKSSPAN